MVTLFSYLFREHVDLSNTIKKLDNMEEQLDDNLSIYCGTTNDDIIVSSGDEWDKTDDSEKDSLQSIS